MQRWMDPGMAVPYAQARPAAQTTAPTPRDDDTPPRRSNTPPRTPDRRPRTPVRRSRTPVRRARVMDDTTDSTRSRSPIRRSSLSDSPPTDASPVNFSAALDSEDKVKDRSITDDEDDDGSQKKVLAAQHQLFRQAVMSSKGSFKVNHAKSRRVSRALLMDLGDSEVTNRVSWLDQPSLMHTMASTAGIAQGLQKDEEVEKTTLSETLNTSSFTFKHLQLSNRSFPENPAGSRSTEMPSMYRNLQGRTASVIRRLLRPTRCPIVCVLIEGVGQEVSHLCFARRLHGGICRRRTVYQSRENEAAEGEVSHYTGSPGLSGFSRICDRLQSPAVAPWRLVEEFWVPASGPFYRQDCTVRGLARSRSRFHGTSEQSENHQTSGQDGWVFSHIRPETPWV